MLAADLEDSQSLYVKRKFLVFCSTGWRQCSYWETVYSLRAQTRPSLLRLPGLGQTEIWTSLPLFPHFLFIWKYRYGTFSGSVYRSWMSLGWGAVNGWWADSSSPGFSSLGRKSGKSTTQRKENRVGSRSTNPLASRRSAHSSRNFPSTEHCKQKI